MFSRMRLTTTVSECFSLSAMKLYCCLSVYFLRKMSVYFRHHVQQVKTRPCALDNSGLIPNMGITSNTDNDVIRVTNGHHNNQKLRLSEHKRKLPKVVIRVNTEIDSSNGKTASQHCLSEKSQINTGGHVALASTHCIPVGKMVQ